MASSSSLKEQILSEAEMDFSEYLPEARNNYFTALSTQSPDLPIKTFIFGMYLVKSKEPSQVKGGINLLEKLAVQSTMNTTTDVAFLRDCYYFAALGHFYLKEIKEARMTVNKLLSVSPEHPQAKALSELLKEPEKEENVQEGLLIAGAIALGAAAIVGALLAGSK